MSRASGDWLNLGERPDRQFGLRPASPFSPDECTDHASVIVRASFAIAAIDHDNLDDVTKLADPRVVKAQIDHWIAH